ncbi:MAG: hypothetical protein E7328_01605 [Clostridiales bacterium]|nr:hypothetical protein [Clostridiales bacterium]
MDGYYTTIDEVMAHEDPIKKGAQEIARIQNGSGHILIYSHDDVIWFYNFKSRQSLTGKKYAVASCLEERIAYDSISSTPPRAGHLWREFSATVFVGKDEADLRWWVVEGIPSTAADEYDSISYCCNGKTYTLLYYFIDD